MIPAGEGGEGGLEFRDVWSPGGDEAGVKGLEELLPIVLIEMRLGNRIRRAAGCRFRGRKRPGGLVIGSQIHTQSSAVDFEPLRES
jgi:hypothetical protein